jgi:hypothetical protein
MNIIHRITHSTMQLFNHIRDQIISTHTLGIPLIEHAGFTPERVEIALAIEAHRWFWKPDKVRLVLVGESHVFTPEYEFRKRLDTIRISSLLKDTPFKPCSEQPEPIQEYIGLVYCLGYGELSLRLPDPSGFALQKNDIRKLPNSGTPQYWRLFGLLAGTLPALKNDQRIPWKIKTLIEMYRKGIWLLDASVHAIYRGNEGSITGNPKKQLHKQWWDGYGRYILKPGNQAQVWVIGKGVYDALSDSCPDFAEIYSDWIYQPNARITNEVRNKVLLPLITYAHSLPYCSHSGKADVAY